MNSLQYLIDKVDELELWQQCIQLSRNEYLTVKGSVETNVYYVLSGSLRAFVVDEFEEHTIRFGYAGNIITPLDSYISGQPTSFYIQAIKKTEVKVISKQRFEDFVKSDPEHLLHWQVLLEQTIFQQMEREVDILTSSPQERYNRVLKRSPQLFQEIPHKYIASYLRMTPETLSRLKKS